MDDRPVRRRGRAGAARARADRENFVLYGQSWGGILAIEYALAHQEHLKGLVISNMMASIPAYNTYAERRAHPRPGPGRRSPRSRRSRPRATPTTRATTSCSWREHYVKHVLRLPVDEWPEPVVRSFARINKDIYVPLQGPSELGASRPAGRLGPRRRTCTRIDVPTLVIGGTHDTMDPAHLRGHGRAAAATGPTCTAPTARTWRCTTTRRPTCAGSSTWLQTLG